jgi:hypothetical protein
MCRFARLVINTIRVDSRMFSRWTVQLVAAGHISILPADWLEAH